MKYPKAHHKLNKPIKVQVYLGLNNSDYIGEIVRTPRWRKGLPVVQYAFVEYPLRNPNQPSIIIPY